jgi:hypothetical protein
MRMRCAVLAILLIGSASCGSSPSSNPDASGPADAGPPPDVAPDGQPPTDGTPDTPLPIDADRDGHPAEADCDDGDPAVWQILGYSFRDADGDGRTVAASGTICSGAQLPPGHATVPGEPDCDDADPAVFAALTGFIDLDGDGFGVGVAMPFCTAGSLPAGFAAVLGDCAPADASRWQDRPYSFRDADGDGAAIAEVGLVCSGAALPAGYLETAPVGQLLDCDDTDPAIRITLTVFVDGDRDGVGAGPGQAACTNGSPPDGFSTSGTDCDDADGSIFVSLIYTAVDFDRDGFTVPSLGTRCTAGTLLPPYHAQPTGHDCNDANPALTHFGVLYPDQDGDGVGAPPRQVHCIGATPPAGLERGGFDEDDGDPTVIESEDVDDLLDLIL